MGSEYQGSTFPFSDLIRGTGGCWGQSMVVRLRCLHSKVDTTISYHVCVYVFLAWLSVLGVWCETVVLWLQLF